MSLFKKPPELPKPVLHTVSFTRAKAGDLGDAPILMEFGGAVWVIQAGDFSRALATGKPVLAERVTDK